MQFNSLLLSSMTKCEYLGQGEVEKTSILTILLILEYI